MNVQPTDEQAKILGSCVAPLVWGKGLGQGVYSNGTVTFFNPEAPIAITNEHVYSGLREKATREGGKVGILNLLIDLEERKIAVDAELDLATFRVTTEEVERIGKIAAVQKAGEYALPEVNMGIFTSGFPKELRIDEANRVGCLSFQRSGLKVKRVSPRLVVVDTSIDPDARIVEGAAKYRPLVSSGGISGSAILALSAYRGSDWPFLLGIVFEEPESAKPGEPEPLEPNILRARPISCVNRDGTIHHP